MSRGRFHRTTVFLTLILLAGAGAAAENSGGTLLRPTISASEQASGHAVDDMERQMAELRALPPAEREAREAKLGKPLEKLVEKCKGNKFENRALFLLAAWRLRFTDGDGAEAALDRLDQSPYLPFKQAGQSLRVQALLAHGDVAGARHRADALVEKVPEFAGATALVSFYERVGAKAPTIAGHGLNGCPADPLTARSEPWLLYLFLPGADADSAFLLQRTMAEVTAKEYRGKLRLVCVTFATNPLTALSVLNGIAGADQVDLLWANPNADGDAGQWRTQWTLPELPVSALVGPDRVIMAAQPNTRQLRTISGTAGKAGTAPSGNGATNNDGDPPTDPFAPRWRK